jgi:F-type H+-transporting ATPase subunit epsilon
MADLNLDIFTPSKLAYSAPVKAVTIPGTLGSFQILHNHAPIISSFELGAIKVIVDDNNTLFFCTSGGTVEVLNNKVKILADSLESVSEIDVERAKTALKRAVDRLANKAVEKIDVDRAASALARANNRIKIYDKYFNYHP